MATLQLRASPDPLNGMKARFDGALGGFVGGSEIIETGGLARPWGKSAQGAMIEYLRMKRFRIPSRKHWLDVLTQKFGSGIGSEIWFRNFLISCCDGPVPLGWRPDSWGCWPLAAGDELARQIGSGLGAGRARGRRDESVAWCCDQQPRSLLPAACNE